MDRRRAAIPANPITAGVDVETETEIPDTPAGQTAEWVLGVLDAEADTTAEEWDGRMHASFTAEVSAEDLTELMNIQIRLAGPFTVTDYEGADRQAVATLEPTVGQPLDIPSWSTRMIRSSD